MASPTRVAVIGAGIAGPLLATLLKSKGYQPVVCERNPAASDGGIMIGIQHNGLRVLNKVPGLVETLGGKYLDAFHYYSALPEDEALLGEINNFKELREKKGRAALMFRRGTIQKNLVAWAENAGIEFKWGHKLVDFEQTEDAVIVHFENGTKESFSFVVGCDGLHSDTRVCLFGKEPADYTGLAQCGGFGPMPEHLKAQGSAIAMNIFGDGIHMIAGPVDDDTMGFAVTRREPEAKETWKALDEAGVKAFKESSVSEWPFGGGHLVKNSWGHIKYGLYDRPALTAWHKGRVVLIGDAAHPTSPHLGQGGNQAFEDADNLIQLLEKYNPTAEAPSTATLESAFSELERIRIPRTAELVKRARRQGDTRVVSGVEAGLKRNDWYRDVCSDEAKMRAQFGAGED